MHATQAPFSVVNIVLLSKSKKIWYYLCQAYYPDIAAPVLFHINILVKSPLAKMAFMYHTISEAKVTGIYFSCNGLYVVPETNSLFFFSEMLDFL